MVGHGVYIGEVSDYRSWSEYKGVEQFPITTVLTSKVKRVA
jgi:hypothetical protein